MKKKHKLTTAMITLAFLAGCGNTDDRRVEFPEVEIITDEQMSNGQDNTVGTEFSFADVSDRTFYFSSGAGGWFTELHINSDGSFKGFFLDDDMGDTGEAYPNGSEYNCEFSGVFGGLEKVDEYTYKMNMVSPVMCMRRKALLKKSQWRFLFQKDASMEALRVEEREWIVFKEAEVKAAGQEYEGGSMQELTELMRAAELTKDRVYELAEYVEEY